MNKVGDNLVCFHPNKDIVQAFITNNVEFILVGGLAIAWYCPERLADDMDLLVNPTERNSDRISTGLQSLGVTIPNPKAFSTLGFRLEQKDFYHADILSPPKSSYTFSEVRENALPAKLFDFRVLVPSVEMLIRMKEVAIRSENDHLEKHINDIELLKTVRVS